MRETGSQRITCRQDRGSLLLLFWDVTQRAFLGCHATCVTPPKTAAEETRTEVSLGILEFFDFFGKLDVGVLFVKVVVKNWQGHPTSKLSKKSFEGYF